MRRFYLIFMAVFGVMMLLFSNCASEKTSGNAVSTSRSVGEKVETTNQEEVTSQTSVSTIKIDDRFRDANTKFSFDFFARMAEAEKDKNVFVSPTSLSFALTMALNGARGETAQSILNTLSLSKLNLAEVNKETRTLKTVIENLDPKTEIMTSNSLWAREKLNEEFVHQSKDFFDAQIKEVDFENSKTASIINGWVSNSTKGKINQIIDHTEGEDIQMIIINALYFKGSWQNKFEPKQTQLQEFSLPDGTKKQQPLMHHFGHYKYIKNDKFQAIRLPYGNGRTSMYVFLPAEGLKLPDFLKELNTKHWAEWTESMSPIKGEIALPKFRLEYENILNAALVKMGMGLAFSGQADFSGICGKSLRVDQVKQKTFVDVNEEGTEAAAVTSIEMVSPSAVQEETFQMIVNRPFFCAICDDQTGTILFMGAIVNPPVGN